MNNHTVYVPEQFAPEAEQLALRIAGGCTVFPGARGLWLDGRGNVHRDDIALVQVFEDGSTARDAIVDLLFERGEMAVAFITNGTPRLVESVEWSVAA